MALDEFSKVYSTIFRYGYSGYSYSQLRRMFPEYNSQIVANALYQAFLFRRTILKTHNYPKKLNANVFLRSNDYKIKGNEVEIIYKPRNRIKLKVFPTEKQIKLMREAKVKGAYLVNKEDKWFLNVILEKEVEFPKEIKTIIGVDLGINYIAVCSALVDNKFTNPLFFKGGEWKHLCDRKRKITNSESYKKITRRQNEILHTVAKRIVEYAKQFPNPIIVLEKLGHFENNTWNKRFNFLLGNWARRKLQKMIEYKANWEGIPVAYVNPAYTSLTCHYCGARGEREGIWFKCSNCGRTYNADANASMNLAKKFRQLLDEPKAMIGKRSPEDLSSSGEGKTYLPTQAQIQPGKGKQMNGMMVKRTVSLPIGIGR